MREARGPEWTDWLRERGVVALTGIDTRSLVLQLRERGAMRAVARRGRRLGGRGGRRGAGAAADGGPRARARGLDAGDALPSARRAARASPSSTTASSAPSCAGSPRRARRDGVPARRRRGHARRLRRRAALAGPGRPGAARRRGEDGRGAARADERPRHLPRPPAARRRDRPRDVQAPVRPPRLQPSRARARVRARARHEPEPRLRRAREGRERRDARLALRPHRRGTRVPGAARAVAAVPPGGGPGPHDAWPLLSRWVDEVASGDASAHRHRDDLPRRLRPDRDRAGVPSSTTPAARR